jgi:hypothetical protein
LKWTRLVIIPLNIHIEFMELEASQQGVLGDRALGHKDGDRLGFREVAQRISKSLVDHRSDGGLVVGLEGRWGSGKSSLLFLIEEEFKALSETERPTVINFRPWLVGNRDALLSRLFDDLAEGISRVKHSRGDASDVTRRKVENAIKTVRDFSARFDPLLSVAQTGSKWASLPFAEKAISGLRTLTKKTNDGKPLSKLKDDLTTALSALSHRFIVMIDDVDRLDPDELIEVLRLVRSVADFPNVVYMLCYDSDIVAKSIARAAKVENGHAYLEKIVQLAVMVPLPEAFQLRRWFASELALIASPKSSDEAMRLAGNIDRAGGIWLTTPRAVVRALDAIRFHWSALQAEGCDLADAVWLTLIKDGNPKLYRWIEDYCLNASEVLLGTAMISEAENNKKLTDLMAVVGEDHFSDLRYRHEFCDHLPGFEMGYGQNEPLFKIYRHLRGGELNSAISDKRLKSPDHFRHYFALSGPSYALTRADYTALWASIDKGATDFAALLIEWHKVMVSQSLSKAELLSERFHALKVGQFTPERVNAILHGFGLCMDDAYRLRPIDPFAYTSLWQKSLKLIKLLLATLSKEQRQILINHLFKDGPAIGWLSFVYRSEIMRHGRFKYEPKHQEDRLLLAVELDSVIPIMADRYQAMAWQDVLETADSRLILWNRSDMEEPEAFQNWIKQNTESDAQFLEFLTLRLGWVESSDIGRYSTLTSKSLEGCMDFDEAKQRLDSISEREAGTLMGEKAEFLQVAIRMGKDH